MTNEDNIKDAEKCIEFAKYHIETGNLVKAERLALKAQRLYPSEAVTKLLDQIRTAKELSEGGKDMQSMYNAKGSALNNPEDAERCIEVAQTAIFEGQFDKARKMLKKAERMFPTARAKDLLRQIEDQGDAQVILDALNRNPKVVVKKIEEKPKKDTSAEQLRAMERVKSAKDNYEVLGLPRDCDLKQVKKAYRHLTLLLHPDKNREPGAKETFMIVISAMETLSAEKKEQ